MTTITFSSAFRVAVIAAVAVILTFTLSDVAQGATDIVLGISKSSSNVKPGDTVTFTVTLNNPTGQTLDSMESIFWGPTGSTISSSRSGGSQGTWDNGTQWGRPTLTWGQRFYAPGYTETFTVTANLLGSDQHPCGTTYGASYQDWTPVDPVTKTVFTTVCAEPTPTPTPEPTPTPTPEVIVKKIVIENNAVQKQIVEQKVVVNAAPKAKAKPAPKPRPQPAPPVRVTATTGPGALAAITTALGGLGFAVSRRYF